jgi:hypothetical protein
MGKKELARVLESFCRVHDKHAPVVDYRDVEVAPAQPPRSEKGKAAASASTVTNELGLSIGLVTICCHKN